MNKVVDEWSRLEVWEHSSQCCVGLIVTAGLSKENLGLLKGEKGIGL